MSLKILRFALAVSHSGCFEKQHFGDADKYLIYELNSRGWIFLHEKPNIYKDYDEDHRHGLPDKGLGVMKYLDSSGVHVLVSRQFGRNIRLVNQRFIPVVVHHTHPEQVLEILQKHIRWIYDELSCRREAYRLFIVKKGFLKTRVSA
ncbi:MAG: NifB/NifX family molybdenum-iron cluster-binding protein [Bacteroidales bacterium]